MTIVDDLTALRELVMRYPDKALDILAEVADQDYHPSPGDILDVIAREYHVPGNVLGLSGVRTLDETESQARKAAIWFLREKAGLKLMRVAEILGMKDHTSIPYALKTLNKRHPAFLRSQVALSGISSGLGKAP